MIIDSHIQAKPKVIFKMQKLKIFLVLLFVCGWLLPKLQLGSVNIGVQELAAVLLILWRYKINTRFFKFFVADLSFGIIIFSLSIFHFLLISDMEGILIGIRTLLFVIASLGFTSLTIDEIQKMQKIISTIYLLFIIISVGRIMINILTNSFDLVNFLYGSDSYRVKAPYENGGASSQVPIGYMLALVASIPIVFKSSFKKIIYLAGIIGTTSRAALLSIIIVYGKKMNFKKIASILSLAILFLLLFIIYLKSFTANSGELDGSAGKRLTLYSNSINLLITHPSSILIGFGLSSKALMAATGEGFYESFIINSLMQGGVLLFLTSIWIIIKSIYYDFIYQVFSVSAVILLGNAIGGSNYFSMFAYPFMILVFMSRFKSQIRN